MRLSNIQNYREMTSMYGTKSRYLYSHLSILLLLNVTGCAGPLRVEYAPQKPPEAQAIGSGTIFIAPYKDARETKSPRHMGTIASPVSDLHGNELILEKDVAALVTEAVQRELTDAGFNVTSWTTGDGAHDWKGRLLKGKVKRFNLAIGPRDEIAIEIESSVVDLESGEVIWEKSIAVEDDRYAGVMGNSRRSIGLYISNTLSRVLRQTVTELASNLPAPAPQPATAHDTVEVQKEDVVQRLKKGRLVITSEPPRAKVYIGDIYYGLTPIEIEIEPGILNVTLRHKDYQTIQERVSVRPEDVTEMEVELEPGQEM
ncbi:MAG: PEGA domain-containing protein [Deltaproteobacteria bacterium]|nr:PEGA domain-containing protein [Deltaproteobacteria bacterium]